MAQQTAVEWLYERIKFINKETYSELELQFQQARQMEKEQKIQFAKKYAKRCQTTMADSKWLEENS